MTREFCEALDLQAESALTLRELVELSGLGESMLRELVDYGALRPVDFGASTWHFDSRLLVLARRAGRLQRDFELDAHALALVLRFAERVEALEAELRAMRARLTG